MNLAFLTPINVFLFNWLLTAALCGLSIIVLAFLIGCLLWGFRFIVSAWTPTAPASAQPEKKP